MKIITLMLVKINKMKLQIKKIRIMIALKVPGFIIYIL